MPKKILTKAFDPHAYSITVRRSLVDGENLFIATVAELPNVRAIGMNCAEAYELSIDAISDLHDAADELGRTFPAPNNHSVELSGRITLRMPPWLHAQLDAEALRDNISLNQTIVALLSSRVSSLSTSREIASQIESILGHKIAGERETPVVEEISIAGYASSISMNLPNEEHNKWKSLH